MKEKLFRSVLAGTLLMAGLLHVQAQQPPQRVVVNKVWYGDAMGYGSGDVMYREASYYNADMHLSVVTKSGREHDTNRFKISDYTRYEYNEKGGVSRQVHYQYGVYDYGDWAPEKRNETLYVYDAKGRLTEEKEVYYYTTGQTTTTSQYTYDGEGNVATKQVLSMYDEVTLRYSDYVAPGKPGRIESTGMYDGDNYTALLSYDAHGNKVKEEQYAAGSTGSLRQVEQWEYDADSNPLSYIKYSFFDDGTSYASCKTVYSFVDDSHNLIRCEDYTSFDGVEWYSNGVPCVMEYVDFSGKADQVRVESSASLAPEGINCVDIKFSAPACVQTEADPKAVIFRNGEVIDTISLGVSSFSSEAQIASVHFVDKDVYNGEYDYFVQPLLATADGGSRGYHISSLMPVSLQLPLPQVQQLAVSSAYKKKVGSGFNAKTQRYATFSWVNPDYPASYGFISNDLMLGDVQQSEIQTADAQASSLECLVEYDTEVWVLSRFRYGKALSDRIMVSLTDLDRLIETGIHDATSADGGIVSFSHGTVQIDEGVSQATLFRADGCPVTTLSAGSCLDLTVLPVGVYLLYTKHNGRNHVYKFTNQ